MELFDGPADGPAVANASIENIQHFFLSCLTNKEKAIGKLSGSEVGGELPNTRLSGQETESFNL